MGFDGWSNVLSEDGPLTDHGTADPQVACSRCRKPVEANWRMCPHCEAMLRGPERAARVGALDSFLHRPGGRERIVKLVFAAFGAVGFVIWGSTVLVLALAFHRGSAFLAFLIASFLG